jgi:hypothetical protein
VGLWASGANRAHAFRDRVAVIYGGGDLGVDGSPVGGLSPMLGFNAFLDRTKPDRVRDDYARREGQRIWRLVTDYVDKNRATWKNWHGIHHDDLLSTGSAVVVLSDIEKSLPLLTVALTPDFDDSAGLVEGPLIVIAGVLREPFKIPADIRRRMKAREPSFVHEYRHYLDFFIDNPRDLTYSDPAIRAGFKTGTFDVQFWRAYYNEPAEVAAHATAMLGYFARYWEGNRVARLRLHDLVNSPEDAVRAVIGSHLGRDAGRLTRFWLLLAPENKKRVLRLFADYLRRTRQYTKQSTPQFWLSRTRRRSRRWCRR